MSQVLATNARRDRAEAEGKAEGKAEVLVRLLENKFGSIPDDFRRCIEQADSEQLLTWAERTLTTERIEDVFGG